MKLPTRSSHLHLYMEVVSVVAINAKDRSRCGGGPRLAFHVSLVCLSWDIRRLRSWLSALQPPPYTSFHSITQRASVAFIRCRNAVNMREAMNQSYILQSAISCFAFPVVRLLQEA